MINEHKQMEGVAPLDQAKRAIRHALERICTDERVAWYCGFGTQTFALLTEAAATLYGRPVREVRENFAPKKVRDPELPRWRYCAEEMPDADLTVLLSLADGSEPVWFGYWDGERWCNTEALPLLDEVYAWADLPEQAARKERAS